MGKKHTLLLKLEGPMQSWGYRSRFDHRDTALEPTRSGVIGLICAAMGIARGEDLSRFSSLRMGVRVDKDGRIERDYHTAEEVIKAAEKAHRSAPDTVVSNRDYLADASFTVGLESEDLPLLEDIADALRNPTWFLFLGRKSFPLTCPPLMKENPIMPEALEDILLVGRSGKRVLLEAPDGERVQEDWPICFGTRLFSTRIIKTTYIDGGGGEP